MSTHYPHGNILPYSVVSLIMTFTGIRRAVLGLAAASAIALTATACNKQPGSTSSVHVNPSAKANAEKILAKCMALAAYGTWLLYFGPAAHAH